VRSGAERADVTADSPSDSLPGIGDWLHEHALEGDPNRLLLRRVVDANGRSRAFINGHSATINQMREAGIGSSTSTASMRTSRFSGRRPSAWCSTRTPGLLRLPKKRVRSPRMQRLSSCETRPREQCGGTRCGTGAAQLAARRAVAACPCARRMGNDPVGARTACTRSDPHGGRSGRDRLAFRV